MDIYTKIQDLVEEMKGDWQKLFMSDVMGDFFTHYAENLFMGVFESLQLQGAQISSALLDTEMKRMRIERIFDPNSEISTACCISQPQKFVIVINGCGSIVNKVDSTDEKFEIVTGLLVHEIGHRLFTDFATANAQMLQMEQYGRWFPIPPTNIDTVEGINLRNMLATNLDFRKSFAMILGELDNAIEDAYEENELRSHYPGLASCYLAAPSRVRYEHAQTMTDLFNLPDASLFQMLLSQWFQYALYGELNIGEKDISEFDPDLVNAIYAGMDLIDDCVDERDPLKRASMKNALAVMAYPFVKEDLKAKKSQSQIPGGSQAANQALQNAIQSIVNSATGGMGALNGGNAQGSNNTSNSNAITNTNKGPNARLRPSVSGPGTSNNNGQGGDRSYENPNHEIGSHDLEAMLMENAVNGLNEKEEEERLQEMQREAEEIFKDQSGSAPEIIRDTVVPAQNKVEYEKAAGKTMAVAHRLANVLKRQLREEEQEDVLKWQYSGRRFSSKQYCRDNLKCFTKKKLPAERFRLRVYVLVDESGSVSEELSNAEVATSMVLEQFCNDMDVPLTIQGYTTGGASGVSIYSYVEEDRIDGQDKYRLMGMSSRVGTPTVAAMKYALGRMFKRGEGERQLLFVITDGYANDDDSVGTETNKLIRHAASKNIAVIGCGIGESKHSVEDEFGNENYLGIDDLEGMPKRLVDIIRHQLIRK